MIKRRTSLEIEQDVRSVHHIVIAYAALNAALESVQAADSLLESECEVNEDMSRIARLKIPVCLNKILEAIRTIPACADDKFNDVVLLTEKMDHYMKETSDAYMVRLSSVQEATSPEGVFVSTSYIVKANVELRVAQSIIQAAKHRGNKAQRDLQAKITDALFCTDAIRVYFMNSDIIRPSAKASRAEERIYECALSASGALDMAMRDVFSFDKRRINRVSVFDVKRNTKRIFDNMTEACYETNLSLSVVRSALASRKVVAGYYFKMLK